MQQNRKHKKSPNVARDLLTGCSGGSDRTLPPSVRSILERSNSSRITTGRVRWSMTRRMQGLVSCLERHVDRPDAGTLSNRTHKRRVRSLLRSKFTSYELIGRWTLESSAASGHSFPANLQCSSMLPVPNQVPTQLRSK